QKKLNYRRNVNLATTHKNPHLDKRHKHQHKSHTHKKINFQKKDNKINVYNIKKAKKIKYFKNQQAYAN
ncbi:hypothetical protein, partial [Salmonella enterica]|uniref:hypothetical protein n=1 Tax=Salmonella enterica TaxID=28901 RepID=UPI0020C1D39E